MENWNGEGNTVTTVAGADIASGAIVVLAGLVGVAQNAALTGETVVLVVEGEFIYPKAAGALSAGDVLNYDASTDVVTTGATAAAGDVTGFAVCAEAAASGDPSAKFKLLPGAGTFS